MLRRLRPVARARAAAGAARAAAHRRRSSRSGPRRRPDELDDAILDVVAAARARRRPHARGRDPARRALEGDREVLLRRAARLRHLRRTCAPTTVLARVDALLQAGTLRSTGGRFPKLRSRRDGSASSPRARARTSRRSSTRVHGREGVEVVAVGSDKPDAQALERARAAGRRDRGRSRATSSPTARRATSRWPTGCVEHGVELVVLAGYMQLARRPRSSAASRSASINVHPALLPAFPGIGAVEQALAYGVKVFGVTVHFVDEGVDTGPIILQRAVELPDGAPTPTRSATRCARSSTSC